jgi:hypothetical protein
MYLGAEGIYLMQQLDKTIGDRLLKSYRMSTIFLVSLLSPISRTQK